MPNDKNCGKCGNCCRVIPLNASTMSPEYRKYLLNRGLKEEQGFILIPHDCQHLTLEGKLIIHRENVITEQWVPIPFDAQGYAWKRYGCDIHDSPDRPFVCRKFTGQKQIGRWRMYIPPSCAFNNKS